jgi:autotransporter-associated beta strand protein
LNEQIRMMKTTGISIVAAVFWAGCAALHAQSLSWDTDPAVPGAQGGTGNWVGPNFWLNGASNQTWPNLSQATFGGTAGTVTVNVPVAVAGMTFNVEAYTINGASTLTLANPVIDVATPAPNPDEGYFPSAVISAPIGGTQGLVKNGVGYLILSGSEANTFTGTTFVNAGAITLLKTAGTPGVTGDLVIGDNVGGPASAGVESYVAHQIPDSARVTVNADGYWYFGGNARESINTLELNGGLVYGSVGLAALRSLANARNRDQSGAESIWVAQSGHSTLPMARQRST